MWNVLKIYMKLKACCPMLMCCSKLKHNADLNLPRKTYRSTGISKVMLSYVECVEDIYEIKSLLPNADVLLKIETQRGLEFAKKNVSKHGHLKSDAFVCGMC